MNSTEKTLAKIVAWLEEKGCGQEKVTYRLRDWLFSRQLVTGVSQFQSFIGKMELTAVFLKLNCRFLPV